MNVGGYNFSSAMGIAAWAEARASEETSQMGKTMNKSDYENQFSQDLTKLQGELKDVLQIHNFGAVAKDIGTFLEKYKDDPRFAQLKHDLQPMIDRLAAAQAYIGTDKHSAPKAMAQAMENLSKAPIMCADTSHEADIIRHTGVDSAQPTSETVDGWKQTIQSWVDSVTQDSQFVMLKVQDMQAQKNQAMDAASALIKGSNDTLNTIIRNF